MLCPYKERAELGAQKQAGLVGYRAELNCHAGLNGLAQRFQRWPSEFKKLARSVCARRSRPGDRAEKARWRRRDF